MKARSNSSKELATVKKPVVQVKSASKTAVSKTPASKPAASATKKASATAPAPAKKVAVSDKSAKATTTATASKKSSSTSPPKSVGRPADSSSPAIPMKKTAAATLPTTPTPVMPITNIAAAPVPARGGRVSRLSQLTVPSMPQSIASTAAKSSFSQIVSTALVPPPPVAVKKDPKLLNNWKTKTAEQLVDAEVIAMPDSEYMNDKQMAFFRLKLQELKRGILENAGETTEHLREDTVVVPDPADRATIEEEHALELRTRDRERKLLKKIEQSIQRIDSGDYGYCDETGEPIGVGRLLARPTATLSLEAQQRRELKQKMFGD